MLGAVVWMPRGAGLAVGREAEDRGDHDGCLGPSARAGGTRAADGHEGGRLAVRGAGPGGGLAVPARRGGASMK